MPGIVLGAGDTVGSVTGGDPCFQELKFQTNRSTLLSPEYMLGVILSALCVLLLGQLITIPVSILQKENPKHREVK